MDVEAFYEEIVVKSKNPDLCRRVLRVLAKHVGKCNPIKREFLVVQALYQTPEDDIEQAKRGRSFSYEDRLIRRTIENLQKGGVPILSSSWKGGYFIAETPDEIIEYVGELENRVESLKRKIKKLRANVLLTEIAVAVPNV